MDNKKAEPFLIEWYKSDTTSSIENLLKETADIAITSNALDDNVIDRVVYAWRDHWMLVGMLFILSNKHFKSRLILCIEYCRPKTQPC